MAGSRKRGSRSFDTNALEGLIAASGLIPARIHEEMVRVKFGVGHGATAQDLATCALALRESRAGVAKDMATIRIILMALGIHDHMACFEDYLLPAGRSPVAYRPAGYEEAVYRVAAWPGDIAGGGAGGFHPLVELGWGVRAARPGRERDAHLLLLGHAAVKAGLAGQEWFAAGGHEGDLVRIAETDRDERGAAAHYLLGRLDATRASVGGPDGGAAAARAAYDHWSRIAPVPVNWHLLLPGLANETDDVHEASPDFDPFARRVPAPHRYLAAAAIRLAWHAVRAGDGAAADAELAKAGRHHDAAGPATGVGRRLNLRLNRLTADVLRACFRGPPRARVGRPVLGEAESVRDDVEAGFQGGSIPRWKHAEWLMVAAFAAHAVRARRDPRTDIDEPLRALEFAREVVGPERIHIAGFERLPQFAADVSPDLATAYNRLTTPPIR